jgi:hypothetical protein
MQMPAPGTLFRLRVLDQESGDLIRQARGRLANLMKLSDGGKLRRIQAAETLDDLLDLALRLAG